MGHTSCCCMHHRGPTGTMLAELADLSEDLEHCQVIFVSDWYNVRQQTVLPKGVHVMH